MEWRENGRRTGAGRRTFRVLALTVALSVLPPLKLVAVSDGADQPRTPAVSWHIEYAEAAQTEQGALGGLPVYRREEGDSADWRIRTGLILLLLSGLGAVTARLWAGALRRPS